MTFGYSDSPLVAAVILTTLKQFLRSECDSSKNTLQTFCLAVIGHGFTFFCTRLHLFTWEKKNFSSWVFLFVFLKHQHSLNSSDFQCEMV